MFCKFYHYGNLNCVFTRLYASSSNKCKGLSFNINSDSFNFKWKLLEALPIKVKQKESAWWLLWWQCFLMAVASLSLYFDGIVLAYQKVTFCFAFVNIIADVALEFVNYFWIYESRDDIFETENISDSIWWL